ncbi:hypothetical protein [Kangiella shandongensis]|uniref:hypothetical protein n=1 Tax=Kangiella shandongensis TaxID=2763258 RepID=UPI001CBB59AD|nr:hypothetical protein [Kangiella shandongensis]
MSFTKYVLLGCFILLLSACNSEPEERTELSDYKEKQLDKAKKIEEEMNKRVDNINKQLDDSTTDEKDDDNW